MVGMKSWNSQWPRGKKKMFWMTDASTTPKNCGESNFTRQYKHQTGICPSLQPPTIAARKTVNVRK